MRSFIAQQLIFLVITTLLFNVSCQHDQREKTEDSQSEWQEKGPKEKWEYTGTYQVTLPCKDCKGIIVNLELKPDGSYKIAQNYNENDSIAGEIKTEIGQYQWNENDSLIILNNQKFVFLDKVLSWKNPAVARIEKDSIKTYTFQKL